MLPRAPGSERTTRGQKRNEDISVLPGKGKYVQGQTTQSREQDKPLFPKREALEAACRSVVCVDSVSGAVCRDELCVWNPACPCLCELGNRQV